MSIDYFILSTNQHCMDGGKTTLAEDSLHAHAAILQMLVQVFHPKALIVIVVINAIPCGWNINYLRCFRIYTAMGQHTYTIQYRLKVTANTSVFITSRSVPCFPTWRQMRTVAYFRAPWQQQSAAARRCHCTNHPNHVEVDCWVCMSFHFDCSHIRILVIGKILQSIIYSHHLSNRIGLWV